MFTPRWESWSDTAKREALAVAVVLATTFGGWTTQQAAAEPSSTRTSGAAAVVEKVEAPDDPAEAVFSFRDALDRVQWQLGFEPDARNTADLTAACAEVIDGRPVFEAAIGERSDELASLLRNAAAPLIGLCESPARTSADREAAAMDGYSRFWEAAYDFAAA